METNIEINPIDKMQEICSLLEKLNCKYEIHKANTDHEYAYLQENDICITVSNPNGEYPIYIDLEDDGEMTLSYYKWHSHYFGQECDYHSLCADLSGIIKNNKCVIIINSHKRWLYSGLSEEKIDNDYNFSHIIKKLPHEFQREIKKLNGNIELYYWNSKDNLVIDI